MLGRSVAPLLRPQSVNIDNKIDPHIEKQTRTSHIYAEMKNTFYGALARSPEISSSLVTDGAQ